MILICSSPFSNRIGRLDELIDLLKDDYDFHHINLCSNIPLTSLKQHVRKAELILFAIQPTITNLKDLYYAYVPHIYEFLYFHPSVKAKTFIIQPFFYHNNSKELRQIFADKTRLGDFKIIPSDSSWFLPATSDEVLKLHSALIGFFETFFENKFS